MHGVGGAFVTGALRDAGYENIIPVPEQYEPDGRFPTVAFPNPEEPGALDLANALAAREECRSDHRQRSGHRQVGNQPSPLPTVGDR
jgi:phosphomannomutase